MRRYPAPLAGIAAGVFGAGLGELTAAFLAPGASPFAAIGSALIDLAPSWAKDAAIALFGTADKVALLVGIALVLMAVMALVGVVEARKPPLGRIAVFALGAIGIVAALTRANAVSLAWAPSAIAAITASWMLWFLIKKMGFEPAAEAPATTEPNRRAFLGWAAVAVIVGVGAAIGGSMARAGARSVEAVRGAFRLPVAVKAAPTIPASLDVAGVAPIITPNNTFFRIDTALIVPQVDPAEWSLRIHGMVEQEVVLTWSELLALPLEESITTLACVSNPVGGNLIGNALWLGYPIRELLARAAPSADADMVLSRSIDGFTASTPLEVLTDERDAILAVGMNGEPLPIEHGFPVRMVVPGLYGYVSATKWVTELEVTRFDRAEAYWTTRGWTAKGPIKLQSRIDVPRYGVALDAGPTVIAGVAWQQHVDVSGVEVQVDDGPWMPAALTTAISDDAWVQWSVPWDAESGSHRIRCRATNTDGETQTEKIAPVVPDGATGWHTIDVSVS